MTEANARDSRSAARPRAKRTFWLGVALGVVLGTVTLLWASFVSGSVGYLPVFMVLFWIIGGLVGFVTALVGLIAWDLLQGSSRWPVRLTTAGAGTLLWCLWLLLGYEGEPEFVWPGTAIAAVLMSAFALALVKDAKPGVDSQ